MSGSGAAAFGIFVKPAAAERAAERISAAKPDWWVAAATDRRLLNGGMARWPSDDKPFIPVSFAVLTVSDSRTLADDRSGTTLAERIAAAGHRLADRAIVDRRRRARSAAIVRKWIADPAIDAVITTGGTGFTGRDVTPEAVEPLFDKRMDGFSAVFHRLSYDKIGTSTIQSRATAGLANGTFVFCLPGSPGACRDAWDGILAKQFDYRQPPCNFVEIMPRLDEHLKRGEAAEAAAVDRERSASQADLATRRAVLPPRITHHAARPAGRTAAARRGRSPSASAPDRRPACGR